MMKNIAMTIFCRSLILSSLLVSVLSVSAADQPSEVEKFEFFDEALRLFTSVSEDGDITAGKDQRAQFDYARAQIPGLFVRDYTDKVANDFSVRFDAPGTIDAQVIGMTPGPWIDDWELPRDAILHLQLKATPECAPVTLALLDHAGRRAVYELVDFKANESWQALQIALKDFKAEAGFDFEGGIIGCEVRTALPIGAKVWFDDIYFTTSSGVLGVTEKPISQRISEARETIEVRQSGGSVPESTDVYAYNVTRIVRGEDIDEANRLLIDYFQSEVAREQYGSGFHFGRRDFLQLALNYGSDGRVASGRLTPETEQALLEVVWEAVRVSDDIANARNSTWWLLGSENHDIIFKLKCLLASQLLAQHPDFADRVYVDAGTGSGYADGDPDFIGEGEWADGSEYTPVDHYQAWVVFFREYLRERAKKGLFVEVRSPHYINHQIGCVMQLQTYCADEGVSELAGMLLDVIWADFIQDSISGINGGAKTRSSVRTKMSNIFIPLLGGPAANGQIGWFDVNELSYELPPILWELALQREGLGDYSYLSRRPGEEEDVWPRPKGSERAMMCDTESRFLRYSWVTPDYVLGTQMDHPAAVHSHLSIVSRWNGVTFSSSISKPNGNKSGVYPYLVSKPEYSAKIRSKMGGQRYWDFMYHSVQDRNVLILQQPKPMRVRHVSPKWYPTDHAVAIGMDAGVYIEDADEIVEQQGWVFVRKELAYVAVRPILLDDGVTGSRGVEPRGKEIQEDSYTWSEDRKIINLKDPYSPIIMETGRQAVNGSFAAFQNEVLANPLRVRNLIAGAYDLMYQGAGPEAKELVFNTESNALPTIGGEPVNYSYPNVFESPYLFSKYNSGVVTIQRGEESLVLDFNQFNQ